MSKVSPTNVLNNNGTLTPGQHDDTDNLINEEILRNSSNLQPSKKDDEMYEGGEDEQDN